MKKIAAIVGLALSLAFVNTAVAHPDEDDLPVVQARQVKLDVQKTAKGASVVATLDGAAYPTAGAMGTLTLIKGSREQVVQLEPSGANAMAPKKAIKIAPGTKARATVYFADKSSAHAEAVIR